MMWYIYSLFGILLRRQVFDVNEGNDDWRDLIHPENYGLTQTQNFYIPVLVSGYISVTCFCTYRKTNFYTSYIQFILYVQTQSIFNQYVSFVTLQTISQWSFNPR